MSTPAFITFCDDNVEIGTILVYADGYPEFVRRVINEAVTDFSEWNRAGPNTGEDYSANELMTNFPLALAHVYNIDDKDGEARLDRCYKAFATYSDARNAVCGVSYEYRVHVTEHGIYY